jgi:predicted RNA-binding protein with TRAM domain
VNCGRKFRVSVAKVGRGGDGLCRFPDFEDVHLKLISSI